MTASTSTILPTLTSEFTETGYIVSGQEHIGGIRRQIIREKVVHASTTAATNLTQKIPANSVVRAVQMKTDDGVTLTTGTHVSIGISGGDLDVYGIVAAASINAANETYYNTAILVTPVAVASETTVAVSATNSGGSASGTFAGTVVVEITIDTYVGIADF